MPDRTTRFESNKVSRRRLLASVAAVTVIPPAIAAGSAIAIGGAKTGSCAECNQTGGAVPPAAQAAGFSRLSFEDNFDSLSTIDLSGTGAEGHRWYVDQPFGWETPVDRGVSVAGSILTIKQSPYNANWCISTMSPHSGKGRAFRYGYFEARISFDPAGGRTSQGFPAFWSMSASHILGKNTSRWGEIDFYEANTGGYATYDGRIFNTVFDWQRLPSVVTAWNRNNIVPAMNLDFRSWHTYACLWRPGNIQWFLDDKLTCEQSYGPRGIEPQPIVDGPAKSVPDAFNILDEPEGMVVVLGSGPGWPMHVDWVRHWGS